MVLDPIQQIATDVIETKERVGRVEEALGRVDERFARVDERLDRVEGRVGRLEVHAIKAEADMAQVLEALVRHDKRFDTLESNIAERIQVMNASLIGAVNLALENFRRSSLEERVTRIEALLANRT